MNVHDAVVLYRRRVVELVEASTNRRVACQKLGIHHSTFYRWRNKVNDPSPTPLKPSRPFLDQVVDRQIVGFSLANPALGPQRVADELGLQGVAVSASRVWRIMVKHRINTRTLRYQLLAGHRSPHDPQIIVATRPRPPGQLHASAPGDLVQFDCFHVGSFKETRYGPGKLAHGQIWQYTAIDVASSWLWVELEASPHNPQPASRLQTRPPGRRRPQHLELEMGCCHHRQRQRIPLRRLQRHPRTVTSRPPIHPSRPTPNQRESRTSPRNPPRRVLPAHPHRIRPTLNHRTPNRPQQLRPPLQLEPTPQRQMEPRKNPRPNHPTQNQHHQMTVAHHPRQDTRSAGGQQTANRALRVDGFPPEVPLTGH